MENMKPENNAHCFVLIVSHLMRLTYETTETTAYEYIKVKQSWEIIDSVKTQPWVFFPLSHCLSLSLSYLTSSV